MASHWSLAPQVTEARRGWRSAATPVRSSRIRQAPTGGLRTPRPEDDGHLLGTDVEVVDAQRFAKKDQVGPRR